MYVLALYTVISLHIDKEVQLLKNLEELGVSKDVVQSCKIH